MARAFLLEEHRLDVSQAAQFGSITCLFGSKRSRNSIWDSEFKCQILEAMNSENYDPKIDYFIVVGSMVPIAIAIATLVAFYGPIQVLLFSAVERQYISRTIGDSTDATHSTDDLSKSCRGSS